MKFLKGQYYFVKDGFYNCLCPEYPNKVIELVTGDILTKDLGGTYTSHLGVKITNIVIPENCLRLGEKDIETIII